MTELHTDFKHWEDGVPRYLRDRTADTAESGMVRGGG